jgi:hypothetical protein
LILSSLGAGEERCGVLFAYRLTDTHPEDEGHEEPNHGYRPHRVTSTITAKQTIVTIHIPFATAATRIIPVTATTATRISCQ